MPEPREPRQRTREEVLRDCGAQGPALDELLAFGDDNYDPVALRDREWPLPDEPHLAAWLEYERDAGERGAFAALRPRLAQLAFPVEPGISRSHVYRGALARGAPLPDSSGLLLEKPEDLQIELHPTPAGRVPVLTAGTRADFVSLFRAFGCRNEPEPVADSVGALLVKGLNNWDRVQRQRRRLETERGRALQEWEWAAELTELAPRKDLYQDCFVLLSRGAYSALNASAAGLSDAEWLERSLVIRREHECQHYATWRVFGRLRSHPVDEVLADAAGLIRAFGRYDDGLALRFLGLEDYPRYRVGGRLETYRGTLTPAAFEVLQTLVHRAVRNLAARLIGRPWVGEDTVGRDLLSLACLSVEELALGRLD